MRRHYRDRSLLFFLFAIAYFLTGPQVNGQVQPDLQSQDLPIQAINDLISQKWDAAAISPALRCSDDVFVRRLYLDLVGRIPTAEERTNFLADGRDHKRELLIDQLLMSEDYVQHYADIFDTLLMGRVNRRKYEERRENQWRSWLERVFRDNRPWDAVASDILLARPDSADDRGVVWFLYERNDNHQAIAEAIAPNFFGIRIDCAQCHDHMIAYEIEQSHYWGLVAFFNRSKNEKTDHGPRVAESAVGGYSEFANLEGSSSPNLLTFFASTTVAESRPEKDAKQEESDDLYIASDVPGEPRIPKFSRRQMFVEQIARDNPLLARSFVNKIWALIMGRGIVHPFDQMDSVHPPSHPELLDLLAADFRNHGYNIRRLVRTIISCDAYQLDARQPAGAEDPALFAWYVQRPLTAEQFARSMQLSLRNKFDNNSPLVAKLRDKVPDVMPEIIVTGVAESLFLTNNPALNEFLSTSIESEHLLGKLTHSGSIDDAIDSLCVAILGREPDAEERASLQSFLQQPTASDDSASDATVSLSPTRLQNAAWALLMSAEFRFNH